MKKIVLTILVAGIAFLGADAQSKTSKKEKKSKATYAKIEQDRALKFEEERIDRLRYDSARFVKDSIKQVKFDSTRIAWKDSVAFVQDSVNTEKYTNMSVQTEKWNGTDKERDAIIKSAKLSDNHGRQVKYINETYSEKAAVIRMDELKTDEEKKVELHALNIERVAKIKSVIGKSKTKKLEKKRKEYAKKNGAVEADAWIDLANEQAVTSNKKK